MSAQSSEILEQQSPKDSNHNHSAETRKRKRSKYIAKACNECKRRKIRCDGRQPCLRCGRQMVECIYPADSQPNASQDVENLVSQVQSLKDQVNSLTSNMNSLIAQDAVSASKRACRTRSITEDRDTHGSTQRLSFHGPTTSSFGFGIARKSLQTRGITEVAEEADITQEPSPMPSPSLSPRPLQYHQPIDPLWVISQEEALRLCRVYEEEMGIMYPVIELDRAVTHVNALYAHLRRGTSSKSCSRNALRADTIDSEDINILKLVFACALTAEENGHSDLGMQIFNSVRDVANDIMWKPPSIKGTIFMTLISIYFFQTDEEAYAWRTIGTVVRMCLEMGLHRKETYKQPVIVAFGSDRVLKLFWSAYTLDIRWSIGTGMPFHLDHDDIDPSLPHPAQTPYITAMVGYSRIAEKVWKFITSSNGHNGLRKDEIPYLDWQVLQWSKSIPDSLKLPQSQLEQDIAIDNRATRSIQRLQCLLYLRANLMRMLIYRPILHTATQMIQNPTESATVVEIAKDTIRFITHLNKTSNIYQLQQVAFNWFLVSALAVLFLAVAHLPSQFSNQCKDEFYMALELVKGFSVESYISQRLWKSIRGLRKLAPKMGLQKSSDTATDHSLGSGNALVGEDTAANTQEQISGFNLHDETLPDGTHMSRELMDWFEAMGDARNLTDAGDMANPESSHLEESYMLGYSEELSSIFKDCF